MTIIQALLIAGAYLLGSIPFGLLFARLGAGVDVRQVGSGNIGATNVLRAAGKGLAGLTLIADVLKGAAPTYLALAFWPEPPFLAALAGLAVFLGHCFPVFIKFRGGKGVATALGVFAVLAPLALPVGVGVFALAVGLTRMVSVGSLTGALAILAALVWLDKPAQLIALAGVLMALIFIRHWSNLGRILKGQEKKIGWRAG